MADTGPVQVPLRALPKPGTDLGAYRIVELLGSGGMGQVFLAEHRKLSRRVALKLLLPQFAGNPEVIARFFHEARAVNQINHAHIVEIVDFVEEPGGFNYFIMELLDGRDLSQAREHGGPFSVARIVSIARQIGSALTATHAHGIVHRDLKPENIYLTRREGQADFVKLLDFGIAKLTADEPVDTRPHTRAGVILGTPEFMSPEQAGGQPVNHRSDLYSMGIILYWMTVDRLPFPGRSLGEILVKQLTERAPPLGERSAFGEPIPRQLQTVIERCLERDVSKRMQDARELVEALGELDPGAPAVLELAPPRRTGVPKGVLGAAAAGVAILAAGALGYRALRAPPPVVSAAAPPVAPALAGVIAQPAPDLPTLEAPPPPLEIPAPRAHLSGPPSPRVERSPAVKPGPAKPASSRSRSHHRAADDTGMISNPYE